jgi:glycosyltransferase involved in cell wall biosynthesis
MRGERPSTWRHLQASDAEWILCSSHLFALHARFGGAARDAPKFVYTHTPARYIWTPELDMRGDVRLARAVSRPLQDFDRKRAQEAHSIAVNSAFVGERVARVWGRESTVIYPAVSVADFASNSEQLLAAKEEEILNWLPDTFILGASRFVPYKRLDVAIEAGVAADVAVVIAGDGPDEERLRTQASQHPGRVTFINQPSSAMLNQLYRRALVLVFPAIEDFGIMPVEAMAAGTPVIANIFGSAAESVVDGITGSLSEEFDSGSLRTAVSLVSTVDAAACISRAWEFDTKVFDRRIHDWIGV